MQLQPVRLGLLLSAVFPHDAFSFGSAPYKGGPLWGSITAGGSIQTPADASRDHMGLIANSGGAEGQAKDATDLIRVRFKNAPGNDRDVVILTTPGKNLLHLGDENGITIPRACRTGLCGTCTASLEDPSWTGEGEEGGSEGIQTIRCCSAQAMVPDGCDEMVIDLFRNGGKDNEEASNPMARFSDNWENEYVADYMKEDRAAAKGDPNGQFAGRGPDRKASSGRNVPNADQTGLNNLAPWDRIW